MLWGLRFEIFQQKLYSEKIVLLGENVPMYNYIMYDFLSNACFKEKKRIFVYPLSHQNNSEGNSITLTKEKKKKILMTEFLCPLFKHFKDCPPNFESEFLQEILCLYEEILITPF